MNAPGSGKCDHAIFTDCQPKKIAALIAGHPVTVWMSANILLQDVLNLWQQAIWHLKLDPFSWIKNYEACMTPMPYTWRE